VRTAIQFGSKNAKYLIRQPKADVAELVDARDLKFVAPYEIHRIFCITRPETKTKIDAKRRDLHNDRIAALAALALITAPVFGQAVSPHCDTWCTAFAWLGGVFEATAPHRIPAVTTLLLWVARRWNGPMEHEVRPFSKPGQLVEHDESFEVQDPATSDQVREAVRRLVELGPRVKK
jgi:hypothetical protein